jgi:hypothetical protein
MHMRITVLLVKLVFSSCQQFQNGTAAIKCCVKLKKMAAETFEMLKSAYGEECLLRMWDLSMYEETTTY